MSYTTRSRLGEEQTMSGNLTRLLTGTFFVLVFLLTALSAFSQENVSEPDAAPVDESIQTIQSWVAVLDRVPESDQDALTEALELSGTNVDTLVNALMQCPDQWLPGAVFVIINMPVEDLTVVSEEIFLDNLRYAYEIRSTLPWVARVSEDDFLHYVLPMRVSQEPLENWRGYFLEQIQPRVEGLETLEEVALEVNRWCGERVGFKQTQRRDQGPFETLASGYGRCEEMMIVYIDACRAVGVPARQAWTPYWGFCDNNHAWAEVLGDDGNWHYTGACEPRDVLDSAWFSRSVPRANLVMSVPFGLPDEETPNLYRLQDEPGARYAIINSIGFYRPSTELTINVVDISGNPIPEINVYLSVFNFGALRPIARGETDEYGVWTITAGPGGYFISTGNEISGACMSFQVEDGESVELTMRVGLGAELPPEVFWLRYPHPEEESQ